MKNNKFKFIVAIVCFVMCFLVFTNSAKADETIENEDQVTEEVTQEPTVDVEEPVVDEVVDDTVDEEVTTSEMIKAFIDEWLIVILATLGGLAGTTSALGLGRNVINKIIEGLKQSSDANAEGNEALKEARKELITGLEKLEEGIANFEKENGEKIQQATDNINNCIKEISDMKTENSKFKELVALLITSNPQLASNGYATKILELLNEGSETNE